MSAWLLPEDVAALIGVSPRTVQRWCNEERIPHWRIGRVFRFTPEQVERIKVAYSYEPMDSAARAAAEAPNPAFRRHGAVPVDIAEHRKRRPA